MVESAPADFLPGNEGRAGSGGVRLLVLVEANRIRGSVSGAVVDGGALDDGLIGKSFGSAFEISVLATLLDQNWSEVVAR